MKNMDKAGSQKGSRVLAQYTHDEFWYPATILSLVKDVDTKIYVRFDDGDKQWCTREMLLPIDIEEGDRVYAKWHGEEEWFPAHVDKAAGDKYVLKYEDGSEERMTVDMIRVTR